MKKSLLVLLTTLLLITAMAFGIVGCAKDSENSSLPSSETSSSEKETTPNEDSSSPSGGSITTPDFEFGD